MTDETATFLMTPITPSTPEWAIKDRQPVIDLVCDAVEGWLDEIGFNPKVVRGRSYSIMSWKVE